MRIFRDKEGIGYIHIADVGKDRITLVTPYNVIKNSERDRFDAPMEGDAHDFLSSDDVTREQVDLYLKKMSWLKADVKELEERKAMREAQEVWEEMPLKQRTEKFFAAWKKASPSVQEEVKLIFGNLGIDLG